MNRTLATLALLASLAIGPASAQYGPGYPMMGSNNTSYTALWWVPSESGWGLNTNQQGDTVFATLFTYAPDGKPMWLVGPNLNKMSADMGMDMDMQMPVFQGSIYRTTGPAFNQQPWTSISITDVGSMSIEFVNSGLALLTYSYNGVTVTKAISRQVFGDLVPECTLLAGSRANVPNYQDLWWNPSESGWGINMVQQGTVIFATLFTYAPGGRDMWLAAPSLTRQLDASYTGSLYSTTGPEFDAEPWAKIGISEVGRMTIGFSAGDRASLTYTVNGVSVTKAIERQVFGTTMPVCQSGKKTGRPRPP